MKELINNLRLDAGISQLKDDPRLVVIDREGNVIDPLIGLEKFAELIVKECGQYLNSPEFIGRSDLDWAMVLNEHFGVEE